MYSLRLKPVTYDGFVQGERRGQARLGYAEPQPIFVQASAIELAHIAERSRKCQEKVDVYI